MIVQTVKSYNAEARQRYNKAVEDWKPNTGGFPFLGMYIFGNEITGEELKTGYVASQDDKHYFAKTRKEAIKRIMFDGCIA